MDSSPSLVSNFYQYLMANFTLANIKDIVMIFTLSMGAYVGFRGLQAWKIQLKGNQDYNLAKSMLINIYKYKESMFQLRHPAVWTYEYPEFTREELDKMNHTQKSYREISYAYQKRWERLIKIKPALYEMVLESQVLWGNSLREIIEKLFKLEFQLQSAISNYIEARNPDKNRSDVLKPDSELVFDSLCDDDSFRVKINEIIKEAEDNLKPRLKL